MNSHHLTSLSLSFILTGKEYDIFIRNKMSEVFTELLSIVHNKSDNIRTIPNMSIKGINDPNTRKSSVDFMNIGFNNELSKIYYEQPICWSYPNPRNTVIVPTDNTIYNYLMNTNTILGYYTVYTYNIKGNNTLIVLDTLQNFIDTTEFNKLFRTNKRIGTVTYFTNTYSKKCTCPFFKFYKKCKHLN